MKTFVWSFLFLSMASLSFAAPMPRIAHFTSDGCSAFPDGTYMEPDQWRGCCFTHDISYWMGGTSADKDRADETFKQCVNQKKTGLGYVTYAGVRIGGSPSFATSWRWGYGWPQGRGYKKLTNLEKRVVGDELDRLCLIGKEKGLLIKFMKENKIPRYYQAMDDFLRKPFPTKR